MPSVKRISVALMADMVRVTEVEVVYAAPLLIKINRLNGLAETPILVPASPAPMQGESPCRR